MTRQARTMLLVGVIALLGIVVLAILAGRYAGLLRRSPGTVQDVASAPPSGVAPVPAQGKETEESLLREVDGFIAARRELKNAMAEHPGATESLRSEQSGEPQKREHVPMYLFIMVQMRAKRDGAAQQAGLTLDRYVQIRSVYRDWRKGLPPSDPALAAALDKRRKELDVVDLGDYEPVDF